MNQIKKHRAKQLTSRLQQILSLTLYTTTILLLSPLQTHAAYDPNYKPIKTSKAAHIAATQKLFTALKVGSVLLALQAINEQADVNAVSEFKETPLTLATHHNRSDLIQVLLDHKADINVQNGGGDSPLSVAADKGFSHCVYLLLTYKADVDIKTNENYTALALAAAKGHTTAVHILLEHKANPNTQARSYYTTLMRAAREGHTEIAILLLNHRASIDMQVDHGITALMKAANRNHLNTISTLILYGANTKLTNNQYQTAYDMATEATQTVIKNAIAKRTALKKEFGGQNWDLSTPLLFSTLEQFMPPVLASIVCDYANPYHTTEEALDSEIQLYLQSNQNSL